jgi:hypothetical protein
MVYTKFFFPEQEKIVYVGAFIVDREQPIRTLIPAVAGSLGLDSSLTMWVYQESLNGMTKELDVDASFASGLAGGSGAVLVLQLPPTALSSAAVSEADVSPRTYRSVFPEDRPTTVPDFLAATSNMWDVELFNFDVLREEPLAVIRISSLLPCVKLKLMIAKLLSLSYSPESDSMVLHKTGDSSAMKTLQIDTVMYTNLRSILTPLRVLTRHRFHFQLIHSVSEEVLTKSSKYNIQWSQDGYTVASDFSMFGLKTATCRELFEALKIECSTPIRYLCVYNHAIFSMLDETQRFTNLSGALRVERIPDDQIDGGFTFLLPVAFGYVQQGVMYTKAKGNPFLLPILDGELFGETKQRIFRLVNWTETEGTLFKFKIDSTFGAQEDTLGDDVVLSEVGSERSTLFIIAKADTKPVPREWANPLSNQPVRIYN